MQQFNTEKPVRRTSYKLIIHKNVNTSMSKNISIKPVRSSVQWTGAVIRSCHPGY